MSSRKCPHEGCDYDRSSNPIALNGRNALLKHCSKVHKNGFRSLVFASFSDTEKAEHRLKYKSENALKELSNPHLKCMFGTGFNWETNTIICSIHRLVIFFVIKLRCSEYQTFSSFHIILFLNFLDA